jgi:CHAT domain-containing protein
VRWQKVIWVVPILFSLVAAGDARLLNSEGWLVAADRFALLHNWPAAAPLYSRAESAFREAGDREGTITARVGYLWVTADAGASPQVLHETATYLRDPIVESNPKLSLRALVAKAALERNTNEIAARESWERILRIATSLNDTTWQNRAKAELGQILYMDGDVGAAAAMFRDALVSQYLHLDLGAAIHYTSMVGNGLVEAGRPETGLKYCDIALKVAFVAGDEGFPFLAYQGKARALMAMDRKAEAYEVLKTAVAQARKEQNRYALAQLLVVRGSMDSTFLEEAVEISRTSGFHHVFAWSAWSLANAYRAAGDLDRAERQASQAIAVMREIQDRYHLPEHLSLLASLETARGNIDRADELYAEATDVIDALLLNVNTRQLKSSLIATLSDVYIGHFELMATKFAHPRKAFEIIERARGRSIADSLRGDSESLVVSDKRSTDAKRAIDHVQLALLKETNRLKRRLLLDALFATVQLLEPVRTIEPDARSHRFSPIPVSDVQAALRPDEALFEYVLGEHNSYGLRITRSTIDVVPIGVGKKRIEGLVDQYLEAVRSRKPETAASQELFAILLKPLLIGQNDKPRLVLAPDGKLHLLPFDGLKDEKGKYVLESRIVTYAPSATVFTLLRKAPRSDRSDMAFLGVGGVRYSGSVGPARSANEGEGVFAAQAVTFSELPGSKQEIRGVAAILPGPSKLLLDNAATEFDLKALPIADYRVVHLAVHGIASPEFPDRAALVLGTSKYSSDDGLLQAREIRDLPLRADLVVLSACETGSGRLLGQEGIASLERAFLVAGARSVIASLWTADDTYTIALMKRFYSHLIDGLDGASALRQAKLDLLKEFSSQALPIYWAGFTLVGDASTKVFEQ